MNFYAEKKKKNYIFKTERISQVCMEWLISVLDPFKNQIKLCVFGKPLVVLRFWEHREITLQV